MVNVSCFVSPVRHRVSVANDTINHLLTLIHTSICIIVGIVRFHFCSTSHFPCITADSLAKTPFLPHYLITPSKQACNRLKRRLFDALIDSSKQVMRHQKGRWA